MQEVSVGGIMSRIQRHDLGTIEVTAITDGSSVFGQEVFPYDESAKLNAMLEAAGKTEIETNFNVFHVQSGDESLLIDCGPRDLFGPNAGYLGDGLKERGPDAWRHYRCRHHALSSRSHSRCNHERRVSRLRKCQIDPAASRA